METIQRELPDMSVGAIVGHALNFLSEHLGILLMYSFGFTLLTTIGSYAELITSGSVLLSIFIKIGNWYLGLVTAIMFIKVIDCVYRSEDFNLAGLLEHAHSRFWKIFGIGIVAGICIGIPMAMGGLILVFVKHIVIRIILGVLIAIPMLYLISLFTFIRIMPTVEDIDQISVDYSDCIHVAKVNIKLLMKLAVVTLLMGIPLYLIIYFGTKIDMNTYTQLGLTALVSMILTLLVTSIDYVAYKVLKGQLDHDTIEIEEIKSI